jgi:hypothetical protein
MKKITISVVAILIGLSTMGKNFPVSKNTNEVKTEIKQIELPVLTEEVYVNDIPFDTKFVYDQYILKNTMLLEDENYINDIPFNTKKTFRKHLRNIKNQSK